MTCATPHNSAPVKIAEEEIFAGVVETWHFYNCAGEVRLLLAIPKGASAETPVVLALPQTGTAGSRELFGLAGDEKLAYGSRFLEAGFVVVSPEVFINADSTVADKSWDTSPFYRRFPQWSALGRMLTDGISVLDELPRLGRRPSCIAAVGHSLGGHNSLFLAAFDKRIDAVVTSGGFESIATDSDAERWARRSWFIYAPALRPFVEQAPPRAVPWDFDDLLGMVYPRPLMIVQGNDDPTWTNEQKLPAFLQEIHNRYAQAGLQRRFTLSMFDGGHAFPAVEQEAAVSLVSETCKVKPTSPFKPRSP